VGPNNSGKSTVLEAISKLKYYGVKKVDKMNKEFYAEEGRQYSIKWKFNTSLEEIYGNSENVMEAFKALKPDLKNLIKEIEYVMVY